MCWLSNSKIAAIASFGVDNVLGLHENIILSFLLAGFLYTVMVIVLVYCIPVVAGLHRQDVQSVIHLGVKKIWNR